MRSPTPSERAIGCVNAARRGTVSWASGRIHRRAIDRDSKGAREGRTIMTRRLSAVIAALAAAPLLATTCSGGSHDWATPTAQAQSVSAGLAEVCGVDVDCERAA